MYVFRKKKGLIITYSITVNFFAGMLTFVPSFYESCAVIHFLLEMLSPHQGMDVIVVSFGTWYDWQSSFSSSSSSSFSSEEENTLSSSLGVRPTAATTFEEVLAQAHVIDANLTARMLETHCPFTDDTQRATFKSNMYEEVTM